MTPQEKLTEIFNLHAGKVVEGRVFEALFKDALRKSLTPDELKEFLALAQLGAGDLFGDKARTAGLMQKTGDGSLGVYGSKQGIYFSVHFLEFAIDLKNVPPAIMAKVTEAFGDCFDKAPDFRDQVKNGKLKPLKPKS